MTVCDHTCPANANGTRLGSAECCWLLLELGASGLDIAWQKSHAAGIATGIATEKHFGANKAHAPRRDIASMPCTSAQDITRHLLDHISVRLCACRDWQLSLILCVALKDPFLSSEERPKSPSSL